MIHVSNFNVFFFIGRRVQQSVNCTFDASHTVNKYFLLRRSTSRDLRCTRSGISPDNDRARGNISGMILRANYGECKSFVLRIDIENITTTRHNCFYASYVYSTNVYTNVHGTVLWAIVE